MNVFTVRIDMYGRPRPRSNFGPMFEPSKKAVAENSADEHPCTVHLLDVFCENHMALSIWVDTSPLRPRSTSPGPLRPVQFARVQFARSPLRPVQFARSNSPGPVRPRSSSPGSTSPEVHFAQSSSPGPLRPGSPVEVLQQSQLDHV